MKRNERGGYRIPEGTVGAYQRERGEGFGKLTLDPCKLCGALPCECRCPKCKVSLWERRTLVPLADHRCEHTARTWEREKNG